MSKDYYNTLGVNKTATQEEIKKAFRAKAHECHPDKAGGDEAKFKEINEAYQVLGDAKKRSQYDQFGSTFDQARGGGFNGFDGFSSGGFNVNMDDLGDIFGGLGDIFGFGGGGGGRRSGQPRGRDIQVAMTLNFNEAIFGIEKDVSLRKSVKCEKCHGNGAEPGTKIETCQVCGGSGRVTRIQRTILGNMQMQTTCEACGGEGKTFAHKCSQCRGTGITTDTLNLKIKIPAGIDNGESIRLSGQGEAGQKGAPAGDLYVKVRVNPDKRFERRGFDIHSQATISFSQAALGDQIGIETVDGPIKLNIPDGTQSGTVFKLRDRGVPHLNSRRRGDHFVEIKVKTPTSLNRKQKELFRELGL